MEYTGEDLLNARNQRCENILKGFNIDIEKAKSGVYEDTPENRKLGRVGQKYGSEKKDRDYSSESEGQNTNFRIVGRKIQDLSREGESYLIPHEYNIVSTLREGYKKWNVGKKAPKGYDLYAKFDKRNNVIGHTPILAVKSGTIPKDPKPKE